MKPKRESKNTRPRGDSWSRKRNRNRTSGILAAVLLVLPAMAAVNEAGADPPRVQRVPLQPELVPVPRGHAHEAPRVSVWTRPGRGAVLVPGEDVEVVFRTNRDAYVVVYNIDTRGRIRKLFPVDPYDDGYVRGKRKVRLPGRGYRLQVQGPPGVERIVALASYEPIGRRWRHYAEEDLYHSSNRHPNSIFRGSIRAQVGPARIHLSGSKRGYGKYKPELVPVPEHGYPVSRDETWFRVARPRYCPW